MTAMQQTLINTLKRENDELKDKLAQLKENYDDLNKDFVDMQFKKDAYKEQYQSTLKEFKMVDDASAYWKSNFENLFNEIALIANAPIGAVPVEQLIDVWRVAVKYDGETDEQIKIKR